MPETGAKTAGYALIAGAALMWSTLGPVARYVFEAGVAPLELSFWRATLGACLFGLHALLTHRFHLERRDLPAVLAFALIGVAGFFYSYLRAVELGGVALAAVLLYTAPAWVALASAVWLRERLTVRTIVALLLTLGGVTLVASARGLETASIAGSAIVWGLLAGLTYAFYYLFGKRYFTRYATTTVFMYALPLGALMLLPLVSFSDNNVTAWAGIAFVAIVPTYFAYMFYAAGLRRISATSAATVATLEPVLAAVLAYLIWNETLGVIGYFGALLVVAGVLLMILWNGRIR